MKTTTPEKPLCKYAAHGEPGTEAWIEVYAENTAIAEQKHKIYAHAPELLDEIKIDLHWIQNLIGDIRAGRPLIRASIEEALILRRDSLRAAIAKATGK